MTFEGGAGERRIVVPRAAVQTIGERTVVYVRGDEEGRFIERAVKLRPSFVRRVGADRRRPQGR
jgi:hypothetical protein